MPSKVKNKLTQAVLHLLFVPQNQGSGKLLVCFAMSLAFCKWRLGSLCKSVGNKHSPQSLLCRRCRPWSSRLGRSIVSKGPREYFYQDCSDVLGQKCQEFGGRRIND